MDSNKTIQEVVVVEGYHDLARLKQLFPTMDIVITNGSEISDSTLHELKLLQETRGLILFLDPDYQGERIRKRINDFVGETKHAFLTKSESISKNKKKIGVEHANDSSIKRAFSNLYTSQKRTLSTITSKDLRTLHLVGTNDAKTNRKILAEKLGIGLSNGKTLLYKLHMFNITIDQVKSALKE